MKKLATTAVALLVATATWQYNNQPGSTQPPLAPLETAPEREAHQTPIADARDSADVPYGLHRSCDIELGNYVTPDGEMFSAYSCTPNELPEPHAYAHYTDETLEVLAYSDAQAAALLGQRLAGDDHAKSYELLIRATALDGDTRHLAWLGDVSFGEYRRNGALQMESVKRRYELAALAAYYGDDPGFSLFLRNELLNAGAPNEEVTRLDDRVQELLDTMRSIQLSVYGEVRHGGRNDA